MGVAVLVQLNVVINFFHQQIANLVIRKLLYMFFEQNSNGFVGSCEIMKKVVQEGIGSTTSDMAGRLLYLTLSQFTFQFKKCRCISRLSRWLVSAASKAVPVKKQIRNKNIRTVPKLRIGAQLQ